LPAHGSDNPPTMKKVLLACAACVLLLATARAANTYSVVADWLKLPEGRMQLGNQHGDVAVSSTGDVYVSVQDPAAGLQVYSPEGKFLRNVNGAPSDFHGFVIHKEAGGEFLYGATLRGQTIVKMTLEGGIIMTIGSSSIPDQYKSRNARSNLLSLLLTGLDVAPNGDIYVTDGYASDYIHRFDKAGKYISSFGGKQPPYSFNTLHKLAIDTRFQPARLIACDRANNRVVHLSLDGQFLGVVAKDLLLPAAIVIDGDTAIVGELNGRVTVLDKEGAVVTRIGANTEQGTGTNKIPPAQWRPGFVLSPHGVALNAHGDLFVSEFSAFGRVHRFNRQ
jgi:DNA-binding beta-propeller fold protein YncE